MNNSNWRHQCRNQLDSNELFKLENYAEESEKLFSLQVPHSYLQSINFADKNDPLLLQILPHKLESQKDENYKNDPVGDLKSRKTKGVIHKYHGRVLLIATGACAINCRYCFRRNFPYTENNASAKNWKHAIEYISAETSLHEVILSGGDPLMLSTSVLQKFTEQLVNLKHIKTLRIHTRMPVVSPERITTNFLNWLNEIELNKVIVIHSNHPNELTESHREVFSRIKNTNTHLLNQSVLLRKINDDAETLCELSHKLFDLGVLPYYLHQLDKVSGASHFQVSDNHAKLIYKEMMSQLPGYLVPKLVQEIAGKSNKTPII